MLELVEPAGRIRPTAARRSPTSGTARGRAARRPGALSDRSTRARHRRASGGASRPDRARTSCEPARRRRIGLGVAAPEVADQLLDAGVDVGAIERRDPGVDERVPCRRTAAFSIDRAVTAGELPAALDHARDRIAGRRARSTGWRRHVGVRAAGAARRVTSACRNVCTPEPRDPETRAAVRIRTGDVGIGRHPVVAGASSAAWPAGSAGARRADRSGTSGRRERRGSLRDNSNESPAL